MRTVLGLSLNAHDVAWVLLDAADGAVLDHDAMELHADPEVAGAAARSAHSIARACGFAVDRVRLTWTDDVARDGLRLRTRLGYLGFAEVEAVPLACATAVLVDPKATGITPRLALAYGAALAVVGPTEPTTVPVGQQIRANGRQPRRPIVSSVLGGAAAAVLALLCLSAGAAPQPEAPATTAAAGSVPAVAGWSTVSTPSDVAANLVRKVVAAPSYTEPPVTDPVPTYAPVRVVAAIAPEPTPPSTEQPHLSDALPLPGPVSGLADSESVPAPEPDMAVVMNALSALP